MNLSFPSTGLHIIVGKSGCGKTTLLNMIGTMDQDYIEVLNLMALNYQVYPIARCPNTATTKVHLSFRSTRCLNT
jgi:ABC-type lipoprotein export system ATPase subunit